MARRRGTNLRRTSPLMRWIVVLIIIFGAVAFFVAPEIKKEMDIREVMRWCSTSTTHGCDRRFFSWDSETSSVIYKGEDNCGTTIAIPQEPTHGFSANKAVVTVNEESKLVTSCNITVVMP